MAKTNGLGDNFYIGGYDLSGDVASLDQISGGPALLDVTPINKSAHVRISGRRDGSMQFTSFFEFGGSGNPVFEHDALSGLPRTDTIASYFRGAAIGNAAACVNGKQINYDPTRDNTGNLTIKCEVQANSYGLEWGKQLTAGMFAASNSLTGDNSTFEGGIGNWVLGSNATIAQSGSQHHGGTKSLAVTSAASGDMTALSSAAGSYATQAFAVVPGNQVVVQAWVRSAVSARTCSVGLDFLDSGGSAVSTAYGTGVADTTSGWTLITATLTVPATSAFASVNVKVASTGGASEIHYVDDVEYFLLPSSLDTTSSLAFGAQAYLNVTAFTGTDATISVQDSADNATFAAVSGLAFAQTTAIGSQRVATGNGATIRRYLAVNVATTAGFTALSFAVAINKNTVAGVTF